MKDIKLKCDEEKIEAATLPIPYPEIKVRKKNKCYAELLSVDFCGSISEFTAINQYVNHEIRFFDGYCSAAYTELAIARTEMMHLEILGKLIVLLGGKLKYTAISGNKKTIWTSKFVEYKKTPKVMILSDIRAEEKAIAQYKNHIKKIDDLFIIDILERIIKDEEYHMTLLTEELKKLK